jgi:hypothetical protein
MSGTAETLAIEQLVYSQLSADAVLWPHITGGFWEGGIPKGLDRHNSRFAVMRSFDDDPRTDMRFYYNNQGKPSIVEPVYLQVDYVVFVTEVSDSYTTLKADADLIYADLHNAHVVVDGSDATCTVIGRHKARVVREGVVWKELGHIVRFVVEHEGGSWERSGKVHIEVGDQFGNPPDDITPMVYSVLVAHVEATATDAWGVEITVEGFVPHQSTVLFNLSYDTTRPARIVKYGPFGNDVGFPRIFGNDFRLRSFEWLHGEQRGFPTEAVGTPEGRMRFRMVLRGGDNRDTW